MPIDDDQLVVVANQVAGAPSNRDTRLQESHLELPQILLAPAIHISNECGNFDPLRDRRLQCRFDITSVKSKYCNFYTLLSILESRKEQRRSVIRLDNHFHVRIPTFRNAAALVNCRFFVECGDARYKWIKLGRLQILRLTKRLAQQFVFQPLGSSLRFRRESNPQRGSSLGFVPLRAFRGAALTISHRRQECVWSHFPFLCASHNWAHRLLSVQMDGCAF